jgi:Predicted transcriptional regulators
MIDYEKIGRHIAFLRKLKGLTGEKLAENLGVSAQAVSKWETGKCLPETNVLLLLSETLDCSIDNILVPKELLILNANYGDGVTTYDVTRLLSKFINNNQINVVINNQFFGFHFSSDRIKILTVKYQTPSGSFFTYLRENEILSIDINTKGYISESPLKIIGAFYGTQDCYNDVINKINHYDYFKNTVIHANHECFPSPTCSDTTEYLNIIYLNSDGIYSVSCAEGESLRLTNNRTKIYLSDNLSRSLILPDIKQLEWGKGMNCTWAGSLYTALNFMGRNVTYEYIMGVSAACFRIAFTSVWDYSSADALVVYDYSKLAYKALGYELVWADRIDKEQRKEERQNIVRDIKEGKPPIAINLRIAPEWGVITGYLENGKELLCRTYFDNAVFDKKKGNSEFAQTMRKTGGYLFADCWPFAIAHFGKKINKPNDKQILLDSLQAKIESMAIHKSRGYFVGYQAYKAWIEGLQNDSLFENESADGVVRRLEVNDYLLINLLDARCCAAQYLKDSSAFFENKSAVLINQMAMLYQDVVEKLSAFYNKLQQSSGSMLKYMEGGLIQSKAVSSSDLRKEEARVLGEILNIEYKSDIIAKEIIENEKTVFI